MSEDLRLTDKGRFMLDRWKALIASGMDVETAGDEAAHDADIMFGNPAAKPPQGIMRLNSLDT